jgi:hypothetical protein
VAPLVRVIFRDRRATPAVLTFLRDTRVGGMISLAPRGRIGGRGRRTARARGRRAGRARLECAFSLVFPLSITFV